MTVTQAMKIGRCGARSHAAPQVTTVTRRSVRLGASMARPRTGNLCGVGVSKTEAPIETPGDRRPVRAGKLAEVQIGLVLHPRSIDGFVGQVREARQAGFASVWSTHTYGPDALTAMAVAAREIPEISFVSAVVPTYPRHPMALAQQAMSVQAASGGRLTLGIGLSHPHVIEGMYGISYERPALHMREYLEILLPLVRTGAVSYQGKALSCTGQLDIENATPFPVMLAALAPKMLELAGSMCDGTIVTMTGPRTVEEYIIPTMAVAADKAGRPLPAVMMLVGACLTDDIAAARERRTQESAFLARLPSYRPMLNREGVASPADISIIGNETEVVAGVERLSNCGATEVAVSPFGSPEEVAATRAALGALAAQS
jgi:F420-dependent oxidoreductase-like protein